MNSEKKEKPRMLAATEEVDKISRSMLVWANTFPEKPVDIIKYEFLSADQGDETGMALSTIRGPISQSGSSWAAIRRSTNSN